MKNKHLNMQLKSFGGKREWGQENERQGLRTENEK